MVFIMPAKFFGEVVLVVESEAVYGTYSLDPMPKAALLLLVMFNHQ